MKKEILTMLTAGMLLLAGCGDGDSSEAGISVSDLTGTWVHTYSDGTDTLTLYSDMTYDKHVKLGGDYPMSADSSDIWSLSDNIISISFSEYGMTSSYTVTLDGDTMTWDNGEVQLIYQRKS